MYTWCDASEGLTYRQCYQNKERELPFGVETYEGAQWFIYSRELAKYLSFLTATAYTI